jgi:uncharacterized protein (DUF2236 family)
MPPEPAPRSGQLAPADHGLFGPASVTWRVMAEPVLWAAAFRALYLQALHPRVMRGTWQHTAFADPGQAWERFLRTAEFVRVRTYGSLAEVERAGRRVRKLHASLRGTDPDGTPFRLDEPELLLWVHCAEIGSYADIARRAGIPLARGELDIFVDEQRRAAAVVGLDPAQVPGSVAGLEEYFARMRPRLRATPEARRALLRSVNPVAVPAPNLPLRLAAPALSGLGFAALPRWARRLYGVPASPLADLATTATLRALHASTSGAPRRIVLRPAVRAALALAQQRARAQRQPTAVRTASA